MLAIFLRLKFIYTFHAIIVKFYGAFQSQSLFANFNRDQRTPLIVDSRCEFK